MQNYRHLNSYHNYKKWFYITLCLTLIVKCFLAIHLPLTGDEAYFAIWGKFLSLGYYDHTPLVGWILYLMLHLGSSNFILRLPTIVITTLIGIGIYGFLIPYDKNKAALIAILYLISPLNLCGMLITTDVPLIFFSFLSGIFLFHALRKNDNLLYYMLAGLCLGLAFFSKYFAVLLGLAYFIYFLCAKKNWKRSFGFVLLFLFVLPFGLTNLYWNYTHAWANILFNVYTRNESIHFQWHTVALYLLILLYIITPPILYYLIKHSKKLFQKPKPKTFTILAASFIIPLLFFLILSTIKSVGLHWPLSFIPFIYLTLIAYLTEKELLKCLKFMVVFTAIHLILLMVILYTPVQTWQKLGIRNHKYADLVFNLKPRAISHHLIPYKNKYIFASPSYSKADLIYIYTNVYSPTFGHGSVHGREGDFLTDFRTMKNKDFLIFDTKKPNLTEITPYFDQVETRTFTAYGATFYITLGHQFNYEKYRDTVLHKINQRYWQVPSYLPHTKSFYYKKYFEEENS